MKTNTRLLVAATLVAGFTAVGPAVADEAEKAQARENFVAADANADQKLDATEFKTFINLNADFDIGRAATVRRFGAYETAFSKVDANGDGFVTAEELAAAAS